MNAAIDVILRTGAVYLVLVVGLRAFGKKELLQLSINDLVFILLISNAVQNAMVGDNTSLAGGLIAAGVLFGLNELFKLLIYRFKFFGKWLRGEPVLLIYQGKYVEANLKREKIDHMEIEAAIREHGVKDVTEVDLAILEIDGNISVVSADQQRSVHRRKRMKHPKLAKRGE